MTGSACAVQSKTGASPICRQDAAAASLEMGCDVDALKLIAVQNDAATHNVVVCTLCSCYPRNLLGLPPDWYKQRAYRSRVVVEPRKVLAEFGLAEQTYDLNVKAKIRAVLKKFSKEE